MIPSATSPMDRILAPVTECLTREVAERLVKAPLPSGLQPRLDELAAKANEGSLTPKERAEYEDFVEGIDVLGIFKAQARLALTRLPH